MKTAEKIKAVLREFNRNKIRYCVLRNYEFLIDSKQKPGFDFDVSIAAEDKNKVESIFFKQGFIKKPPQFSRKHQGYGYFSLDDMKKIGFDVQWDGVVWNDMYYLKKDIYSRSKKAGGFNVLSDNDAFIMYVCHSLLGKRYFKPKYKQKLQELSRKKLNFIFISRHLSVIFKDRRIGDYIVDLARQSRFDKLLRINYKIIRKFILWNNALLFARLFFRWVGEKKLGKRHPLISFIGPDGSGKSTITENIREVLNNNLRKSEIVYLGRGRKQILPIQKAGVAVYKRVANKAGAKKPPFFVKLIYALAAPVYALDLYVRYWLVVWPKRRKNIVLTDRYCTDILLMPIVSFGFKKFLFNLFPRPTMTFYLYNDAEVLYRRRREQSIEELKRQMNIFEKINKDLGGIKIKTKTIDLTLKEVANGVFALLIKYGD